MDANGDYTFGTGVPFLVNTPECVAQAVLTRLNLMTGEWFLDTSDGTDYDGGIIGHASEGTRDIVVRLRILGTPGVTQIDEYISYVDNQRNYVVLATIDTLYGQATLAASL
jgi:hypothetical protein